MLFHASQVERHTNTKHWTNNGLMLGQHWVEASCVLGSLPGLVNFQPTVTTHVLDVLLSQALAVAENKNEMKNISQLPLFIYPGDSEFVSQEILRFCKRKMRNTGFVFSFLRI